MMEYFPSVAYCIQYDTIVELNIFTILAAINLFYLCFFYESRLSSYFVFLTLEIAVKSTQLA